MALIKDITNNKGVVTSYHRIDSIHLNAKGELTINVISYTNTAYRDIEKDYIRNNARYDELMNLINTENEKPEEERDTKAVVEWSEELNNMSTGWVDVSDESNLTYADKKEYQFENIDVTETYNYASAYDLLKSLDDFIGAENHIEQ